MVYKLKNSENFFPSNLLWPKKFGARTPIWKFQSIDHSVNEKIPKNFDLKFCVTKKSWCKDIPLKNSESKVLCKWENSKNFWSQIWHHKKSCCPDPPHPQKIRVHSALSIKTFQKFFPSNLLWPKKFDAQIPVWKFQSSEHSVSVKILKNFWPQI